MFFGKTDAVDINVIHVELVVAAGVTGSQLGCTYRDRLQDHVGQGVRGFPVVKTQGTVEPFRAPLGHQAEITMIVRCVGMAITQTQELIDAQGTRRAETGVLCRDQRQVVAAILQTIVKAQVRAGFRQSRCIPVEKVLGGQG